MNTQYCVRKTNGSLVIVCAKTFSSITTFRKFSSSVMLFLTAVRKVRVRMFSVFFVDRKRLNRIAKNFFETGASPVERRGGERIKKDAKDTTQSIIAFIKRIPVEESHYGRGVCGRQYMSPELSVTKLWKMWKKEREATSSPVVSLSTFGNLFRGRFNIAFGKPKVDVCSYCEETTNRIQAGVDAEENRALLRLHRARAKQFYKILKESAADQNTLCIAFDMQQNRPLPKTNVGEAYYARQLWLYNVTFVIHKKKQSKHDVHIFRWLESESGKGSNEIVSALSYFFENVILARISVHRYKRIRFFCDACPGQNKNSSLMVFLMQTIARRAVYRYVREMEVFFPIRGHSYLPPDRVFGRIEREQRRIAVITSPAQYQNIDERYGTVYTYSDDWNVYDWKSFSKAMLRDSSDLQITKTRVWRVSRRFLGQIEVQNAYGMGARRLDLVKGPVSRLFKLRPKYVASKSHVSNLKRDDVRKLLHFVPLTPLEQEFYDNELGKPCKVKEGKRVTPEEVKVRGRPRKNAPVEPVESIQPVAPVERVTRKRGLPRKNASAPALPASDDGPPPVKRGRGRPRKQ